MVRPQPDLLAVLRVRHARRFATSIGLLGPGLKLRRLRIVRRHSEAAPRRCERGRLTELPEPLRNPRKVPADVRQQVLHDADEVLDACPRPQVGKQLADHRERLTGLALPSPQRDQQGAHCDAGTDHGFQPAVFPLHPVISSGVSAASAVATIALCIKDTGADTCRIRASVVPRDGRPRARVAGRQVSAEDCTA